MRFFSLFLSLSFGDGYYFLGAKIQRIPLFLFLVGLYIYYNIYLEIRVYTAIFRERIGSFFSLLSLSLRKKKEKI